MILRINSYFWCLIFFYEENHYFIACCFGGDLCPTQGFNQATITTKQSLFFAPEGDDAPAGNFTSESGDQVRVMRFGGDGETKTTTWLKNDLVKTFSESEMGRTTLIRDNSKKDNHHHHGNDGT